MTMERIDYSPRSIASETLGVVRHAADTRGLALKLDISDDLPDVAFGDPIRLRQILINLASNAVKFTDEGSISISMDATTLPDGTAAMRIVVADTGIGIAPDKFEVIFAPFSQADGSTSRKYGGTGLGLTITNLLVELAGGNLNLESTEGEGTTFTLDIPLDFGKSADSATTDRGAASAPDAPDPDSGITTDPVDESSVGSPRILIVDDNEINLKLARKHLNLMGCHDIHLARNGRECVRELEAANFDLVLLDMQMPVMSGYEAAAEIRRHDRWRNLPIIALTANAMVGDAERSLDAGCDAHLPKPYNPEKFRQVVGKHLNLRD